MISLAPIVYTGLHVANQVEQGASLGPSDFLRTMATSALILRSADIAKMLDAREISPEVAQALQDNPEQPTMEATDALNIDPNLAPEFQEIANELGKDGLESLPDPFAYKLQETLNPSLKAQLENGEECVVLNSKLIGAQDVLVDGHHATQLTFQQHVADIRDIDVPHILELVQALSNGQNIHISDVAVACIKDMVNDPKAFLMAVANLGQIYQALHGTREVSITLFDQNFVAEEAKQEYSDENSHEEYNSEGEKVKITKKTDYIKIQSGNIQTSHIDISHGDAKFEGGTNFDANTFKNKNYSADIIHTTEVNTDIKREYSITEDDSRLKKIFGGETAISPVNELRNLDTKETLYIVENRKIFSEVADGRLTNEELSKLNVQELDRKEYSESNTTVVKPESREFSAGYIEYVPLGSIVTLGSKSIQGFEVTIGDIAWAVTDGALTAVTAGAGAALFKGATSVVKVANNVAKIATKEGISVAAKSGAKAFGKVAVQTGKEMIQMPLQTLKGDIAAVRNAGGYLLKNGPTKTLKYAMNQVDSNIKQISNVISGKNKNDLDKLQGLELKHHPNATLRNTVKIPDNPKLAAKYPQGVGYNNRGYADFSPYEKNAVNIQFSNNRAMDFAAANKAAGYPKTPEGYTWHHCEDGHTMRLVPTDLHNAVRHGGGYGLHKQQLAHVKELSNDIVRGSSFAGMETAKIVKNSSEPA